jgi:hypothetical protein
MRKGGHRVVQEDQRDASSFDDMLRRVDEQQREGSQRLSARGDHRVGELVRAKVRGGFASGASTRERGVTGHFPGAF